MRTLGDGVSQVDVRTRTMRALEEASLPLLFQALLQPQSLAAMFGNIAGPVPGAVAAPQPQGPAPLGTQPQQQQAASFLQQLLGATPAGPSAGVQYSSMAPPAPSPGVQMPPTPGAPPAPTGSAPRPVSDVPKTFPGAGMPDLPNQYGGIGSIIPGWVGAVDPITGKPATGYGASPEARAHPGDYQLPAPFGRVVNRPGGSFYSLDLMQSLDPDVIRTQNLQKYFPGVDFRATGGPLDPNRLTVVGEQGPELIAPSMMGPQVIPMVSTDNRDQMLQQQQLLAGGGNLPWAQAPRSNTAPMGQFAGSTLLPAPAAPQPQTMPPPQQPQAPSAPGGAGFSVASGPTLVPQGQNNFLGNIDLGGLGGLPQLPQLPQLGGFQATALQGAGTGAAARLLDSNPEMQAFQAGQQQLMGGNPGQGVIQAMQPVFQQNLQNAMGQLRTAAPNVFGTGFAGENFDLARSALNDFNLLGAQALQQGVTQQQQGLSVLGQLAGQAGQNPFQRALGAGGLGLQEGVAQTGANQQAAMGNAQNSLAAGGLQQQGALDQRGQNINAMLGLGNLGLGGAQLGEQARQFNQGQLPMVGAQTGLLGAQANSLNANAASTLGMLPYQQQLTAAQTTDIGAGRAQQGYGLQTQRMTGLGSLANDQLLGLRGQDIQQQLALAQLGQQQQQFLSQFGLSAQNQAYQQAVNPTLQLLMAALGAATPTAYQTIVRQK